MSGFTSVQHARGLLTAAIPDLAAREVPYSVALSDSDPELIEALVAHIRDAGPRLRAAAAARDYRGVAGHAHGLKGMGGSVGLPEISVLGQLLEEAARGGQPAEVDRLCALLSAWVTAAEARA